MYLTSQQIKEMTRGVARIEETEGVFRFLRFTEAEQEAYANHPRNPKFYVPTFHTAGVRWAFRTDSEYLDFDISNDIPTNADNATFDVYENGALCRNIKFEFKYVPFGRLHIPLSAGDKLVELYFPYHARLTLANVEIADGATFEPTRRKYKMLAYGDSITHGSSTSRPSLSYAVRVAAMLNADIINKGIGGEHFFPQLICDKTEEEPDWITVAYGTNDWKHCTQEEFDQNCTGVLRGLTERYPGKPIFVISPTWRADGNIETPFGAPTSQVHDRICKNAAAFPDVTVIRGWDLVPHEKHFFADSRLHPNDLGFEIYAANLYRELIPHLIEKLGYSFS